MRKVLIGLILACSAAIAAKPAIADSLANACLKEISGHSTLDDVEDWISNADEGDLRRALFTCSLDRYSSSRKDLKGATALCSNIEPTAKIGLGDIYLLGMLSKAAPVVNPGIELAMEDGVITLQEKNRLCRLVEAATHNR